MTFTPFASLLLLFFKVTKAQRPGGEKRQKLGRHDTTVRMARPLLEAEAKSSGVHGAYCLATLKHTTHLKHPHSVGRMVLYIYHTSDQT